MSDHYCCKRCGQRYDVCSCPPLPSMKDMEKRLNFDTERRIDCIALAVMMANHYKITVSPPIQSALDDIGVMLLGQIRRELGLNMADMQKALDEFSKFVQATVNKNLTAVFDGLPRS